MLFRPLKTRNIVTWTDKVKGPTVRPVVLWALMVL